jgi:hypothetical protein
VDPVEGLNADFNVQWFDESGNQLESNLSMDGDNIIRKLIFNPVLTTDAGKYICRANASVGYLGTRDLPTLTERVHMPVITQTIIQLKMGPVEPCTTWDLYKTKKLEKTIKDTIEEVVREKCCCDFEKTAIYEGEFSCHKSTKTVVYRARINGTTDIINITDLIEHIEEWKSYKGGSLLHGKFRLKLATEKKCPLEVGSFDELECEHDPESYDDDPKHDGDDDSERDGDDQECCNKERECCNRERSTGVLSELIGRKHRDCPREDDGSGEDTGDK